MRAADSILDLARTLVAIPSRAGVDAYDEVAAAIAAWLRDRGITPAYLRNEDGRIAGITARLARGHGPTYLLAATLDTAPFGDESTWTSPPLTPAIRGGWLLGRGSADSKTGIAIFCHVAAAIVDRLPPDGGALEVLFDADEHNGAFTGARRYLEADAPVRRLAGAFLGYPNNERLLVGSRGFERAIVAVPGVAAHSGSARHAGVNAVTRAADIARRLSSVTLPADGSVEFPLPPKLTVTGIHGGDGFSQIPDRCQISVDVRLTPSFGREDAHRVIEHVVNERTAGGWEAGAPSIHWLSGWPAYRIPNETIMVQVLKQEAEAVFGREIPLDVAGPSNIGNYLALHGIPTTCGFGVTSRGTHGADEGIEIATIEPVFRAYRNTVARLLGIDGAPETCDERRAN